MNRSPISTWLAKSTLRITLFLLLVLSLGVGCSDKALLISPKTIQGGLLSKDVIEFSNNSPFHLTGLDLDLQLRYSDHTEKYNFKWSSWLKGEKQKVEIPKGFQGLQTFELKGSSGGSFQGVSKQDKDFGPQIVKGGWYYK